MIKNTRKITRGRKVNASTITAKDPSGKLIKTNADYTLAVSKINTRFEKMKTEFTQLSLDEMYHLHEESRMSSTDRRAFDEIYTKKVDDEYRELIEKGVELKPTNKLLEFYINDLTHKIKNKQVLENV